LPDPVSSSAASRADCLADDQQSGPRLSWMITDLE
jgi:hypothetical protein